MILAPEVFPQGVILSGNVGLQIGIGWASHELCAGACHTVDHDVVFASNPQNSGELRDQIYNSHGLEDYFVWEV